MMSGILSHVSLGADNLDEVAAFYDIVMPVIGAKRVMTIYKHTSGTPLPNENKDGIFEEMGSGTSPTLCPPEEAEAVCIAYGKYYPEFFVGRALDKKPATNGNGVHVAFHCKSQAMVNAFYEVAIRSGAVCNGPAGPRPHYGPQYYGAFMIDPAGNKIEAMYWDMGVWGYCTLL